METISSFVTEYRWLLLIYAELIFWGSLITFFILRYWYNIRSASYISIIVIIANEIFMFSLGLIEYLETGRISTYQSIIFVAIIYSLTLGKKDIKRLDAYFQRKIQQWKANKAAGAKNPFRNPEGKGRSVRSVLKTRESRQFYIHTVAFVLGQVIIWVIQSNPALLPEKILNYLGKGAVVWTIVYIVYFYYWLKQFFTEK
ncbi:hypothetical protein GXN76_08370 [Kroppenstedtia pulmonis]|uniref:Integral membrane protein n=1 Tax=Kroppenstedtia pulmonis TaxID=1380685 RepID=A0A7D3XRS9_9BACL|nr:hypothetical protein [Kroppenstedtia pulmonis]QKG84488.1 hypothetical protein GXN76_08370 [Kroppenstedtia pulmonis]